MIKFCNKFAKTNFALVNEKKQKRINDIFLMNLIEKRKKSTTFVHKLRKLKLKYI